MRPAISVILLTTLIGAGQGLFLALFTAQSYALFDLLPVQDGRSFYAQGSLLALALLTVGLIASFFHLGRPERAWRSAAQWRSSWLSREVIVLPAFMGLVLLYGLAHWSGAAPVLAILPGGIPIDVTVALGILGTLLAFLLFVCTGMIYACIRFLPEWHSPLTVINYILQGGASGFTLATLFASHAAPELTGFFGGWALIITLLGLVGRSASLLRNARLVPKSSLQTAIGIKHPVIAQRSQGFMGGSFNTREFFHGQTAALFSSIKWLFLLGAFVAPTGLLALGLLAHSDSALALAALVQYCGLLAERWFFFAQASHPQNIYYQRIS
ncbi:MAG TPA: DmsC/YnfH family molybdoenzyme membrane anchor subunit [Rhodocyclaceae bacterium]|nr:DmsC/YnfH family molybdoenzyme membrane anchor subunit [Rhodocyclaceae bacterium]